MTNHLYTKITTGEERAIATLLTNGVEQKGANYLIKDTLLGMTVGVSLYTGRGYKEVSFQDFIQRTVDKEAVRALARIVLPEGSLIEIHAGSGASTKNQTEIHPTIFTDEPE